MRKLLCLFTCILFIGFVSCSDDEDYTPLLPEVSISTQTNEISVLLGDTLYLKASIKNMTNYKLSWSVNGKEVSTDSLYKFSEKEIGDYSIKLTGSNNEQEVSKEIVVDVYGKYKYGTFVLNEGNASSGNGSLIFISPSGVVTDSVYYRVNGTTLGSSAQDLYIAGRKIYIISQNKKRDANGQTSDGRLIVANAETLEKVAAYNDEVSTLSWPSHIAVLGDNIFIRDNNGVHCFNPSTKELKLIKGTRNASKNRMAVVQNKIFVPAKDSIWVMENGKDEIIGKIGLGATVSGVIKSSDNNLWVSTSGTPGKIMKIDAKNYSIIKTNEITVSNVSAGVGATPGITAKGDTLYYNNSSTTIYRHIFSTGESKQMVNAKELIGPEAGMAYNNMAVNPQSGDVYLTTIKGYGLNYLINHISAFNFSESQPKVSADYKNYTQFPAGIFFTYDYK